METKQKNYRTVGSIPKSKIKIVESGKIDTPYTHVHGRSLPGLVQAYQ